MSTATGGALRFGDPYVTAELLGLKITESADSPVIVGSDGDWILIRWDPDPRVRCARAWEGVAMCLLMAAGVPWGADAALVVAARLKLITGANTAV